MKSESAMLTGEWDVRIKFLNNLQCCAQLGREGIEEVCPSGGTLSTSDRRSRGWNRTILIKVPANQRHESSLTKQHK